MLYHGLFSGEYIIFEEIDEEEMLTFHGISYRNDEFARRVNCLERAVYFVERHPILSISGHHDFS